MPVPEPSSTVDLQNLLTATSLARGGHQVLELAALLSKVGLDMVRLLLRPANMRRGDLNTRGYPNQVFPFRLRDALKYTILII